MKHALKPHQQQILDRLLSGEDVVLDKTTRETRAYWRLTLEPVQLSVLRTLRRRGLIRLTDRHSEGITIWGVERRLAA